MHKVHSLHIGTGKIIISCEGGNHSLPKEHYTLMASTNQFDKNHVEIYEGDLVTCVSENTFFDVAGVIRPFTRIMEVRFHNGAFMLYQEDINKYWNMYDDGSDLEVLGNIYQKEEMKTPPIYVV